MEHLSLLLLILFCALSSCSAASCCLHACIPRRASRLRSLSRKLRGEPAKTEEEYHPTSGIDVRAYEIPSVGQVWRELKTYDDKQQGTQKNDGKQEKDTGPVPTLQVWDFAGLQENLFFLHGHGIYAVVCDSETHQHDPWSALRFWLWAVSLYTSASADTSELRSPPPIFIICTHWSTNQNREAELQKCIDDLLKQLPRLRQQVQMNGKRLFFPVDNFQASAANDKEVRTLRERLENSAKEQQQANSSRVPKSWNKASELFARLAAGAALNVQPSVLCRSLTGGPNMPRAVDQQGSQKGKLLEPLLDESGFTAPANAFVEWGPGALPDAGTVTVRLSCQFIKFEDAKTFCQENLDAGAGDSDVSRILSFLHSRGRLFWLDGMPGRPIVLNVKEMAAAICNFEGSESPEMCRKLKQLKEDTELPAQVGDDIDVFRDRGIVSADLLRKLLSPLEAYEQGLLQEVMVHEGMLMQRSVGEFAVPAWLPLAHLPDPPKDECIISYVEMEGENGFVPFPMSFFPRLAAHICTMQGSVSPRTPRQRDRKLKPGPPQLFQNRLEFLASGAMSVSMFPPGQRNPRLLRFVFQEANKADEAEKKKRCEKIIKSLFEALGFAKDAISILDSEGLKAVRCLRHVRWPQQHPEDFIVDKHCLNIDCDRTCRLCSMPRLLKERFMNHLSAPLREMMNYCSLEQAAPARPSGSFRYESVKFPGDVDIEEYVTVQAQSEEDALKLLAGNLQDLAKRGNPNRKWGCLIAGKHPVTNTYLEWSKSDVLDREKEGQELEAALRHGHKTWTAKLEFFGRISLFRNLPDESDPTRYYEITNVIRLGFDSGDGIIHQVTLEKDFLKVVEKCMTDYAGPHPKMMKFAAQLI